MKPIFHVWVEYILYHKLKRLEVFLHFLNSLVYHPDGWELCVTGKKRGLCKKEDGQILRRNEISCIFSTLEEGKTYLSPEIDSTGKKKATILEVKYHNF